MKITISSTLQPTAVISGCCIGHAWGRGSVPLLPNSSRADATTELTGFQFATGWSQLGSLCAVTNAFERNVSGNIQMKPALCATSTLFTDNPIVAETHDIEYAKRNMMRYAAIARPAPRSIRQPTSRPH